MFKKIILLRKKDIVDLILGLPESGPFGEEKGANEKRSVIFNRVITSDCPSKFSEMHENFTDIFIVVEGDKEVFIGEKAVGPEQKSPGEWAGGAIIDAESHHIEGGDILVISKGLWHCHGKGVIKMIVIKVA